MAYLLDANVFIQAGGSVFSIERVGDELAAGEDRLAEWAEEGGRSLFLAPDSAMLGSLPTVSTWVSSQSYSPAAVNTFLQVADYYLVARALAHDDVVVTHEVAAESIHKVKIPSVCIGLGIKCMTPFEMLRKERARFVLGKVPSS